MDDCTRTKSLLFLSASGDLPPDDLGRVSQHLAVCTECRTGEWEVSQVISAARAAGKVVYQLPAAVRQRIALDAARQAARRPWTSWLPAPGFQVRYGVAAAALVCVVGLLVTLAIRRHAPAPAAAGDVTRIEVVADRGVVRLAWSDGQRESYTVVKSTDPRSAGRGEVHVVRGNVWVDRQPDSSPVVFYRIE